MVQAVDVPVTLKIRTGWDQRSSQRRARGAGSRSRPAYARSPSTAARALAASPARRSTTTIAAVKSQVRIPVIANGDIDFAARKPKQCSSSTGADAVMIGRAAQGRPWIFREIAHYLATGEQLPPPSVSRSAPHSASSILQELHAFYGEEAGVRIARKHICLVYQRASPVRLRFGRRSIGSRRARRSWPRSTDFSPAGDWHDERLIYGEEELAA